MAHLELGYNPRSRAPAPATSSRLRHAEPSPRPAPTRPAFSRIGLGQLIRSAFLVLLCLGLSQLARAEKTPAAGGVVVAPPGPEAPRVELTIP